jgi:hypothetical protein
MHSTYKRSRITTATTTTILDKSGGGIIGLKEIAISTAVAQRVQVFYGASQTDDNTVLDVELGANGQTLKVYVESARLEKPLFLKGTDAILKCVTGAAGNCSVVVASSDINA